MKVTTAVNGYEAFQLIKKQMTDDKKKKKPEEDSHFSLILLDLNMPISDGYDACKNILKVYGNRVSNIAYMKPVIIACTSHLDVEVI